MGSLFLRSSIVKAKKCKIVGCSNVVAHCGFCNKHYLQMYRHGRIFERTVYDPNEFTFKDGLCYIQLYDQKGNEAERAIIDIVDYPLVKNHKWHLFLAGGKENPEIRYVRSRIHGRLFYLHQFLMGTRNGTDHKNGDTLDNRRRNLRFCTQGENTCNQKRRKDNTSGYKGVSFHKIMQKWRGRVNYQGKEIMLGYFDTPEDGAIAYNKKAIELHGEFAKLNNL